MSRESLRWQSKLVLLLVLPVVGCGVVFETYSRVHWFVGRTDYLWVLGLSAGLGILTLAARAATPFAALTGSVITAQLIYATGNNNPFKPWQTFLVPVLAVSLLAYLATSIGRSKKIQLGTAEEKHGRSAAQVAANLGIAALLATDMAQNWDMYSSWMPHPGDVLLYGSLAAMAEAAADTVSSEIGQVFGGHPRLFPTMQPVDPGTDGGITLVGTLAGIAAAAIVAGLTMLAIPTDWLAFKITLAGAVVGLFFDSLLGATLERKGWLNNDSVNFLSTFCAASYAVWLAGRYVHFVM